MFENKQYDIWWKEMELKKQYPRFISYQDWLLAHHAFASYERIKRKRFRVSFENFLVTLNQNPITKVRVNDVRHNNYWKYSLSVSEKTYEVIQLCLSPHSHALLTRYWIHLHN